MSERNQHPEIAQTDWRAIISRYATADVRTSLWQLTTTLFFLVSGFVFAYWLMPIAWWAAMLMALPLAGLLIRTFIIMHDCAHGSFLPWSKANDTIGFVTGVISFTPFQAWRREHALHHASSGDLDHRGVGDIVTLTVSEYQARSRFGRFKYWLYRHPVVLFGIGPLHMMILQRFKWRETLATGRKQLWNVWMTNIALLGVIFILGWTLGWKLVLLVYFPAYYLAAAGGIGLFYVQHQFEEAYWERGRSWDYATAAVTGSSHLKMPGILNWFTGHIGLHHVHHLGPKIPNYRLKQAHEENEVFQTAPVLTIWSALKTLRLTLWDEQRQRMIGFREYRRLRRVTA